MSAFSKRQYEFLSNWCFVTQQPKQTIKSLCIYLKSDNQNFDWRRFYNDSTQTQTYEESLTQI